jgi:hypothetical protein
MVRSSWLRLLSVLPVVTLAGCLMVPLPVGRGQVLAGQPVIDAQMAFFRIGETTAAEVQAKLGPATVIWDEARIHAYHWDLRGGVLVWAIGAPNGGAAGSIPLRTRHALLIQFDEAGRVQRFERVERPWNQPYDAFLRNWAQKTSPPQRTTPGGGR